MVPTRVRIFDRQSRLVPHGVCGATGGTLFDPYLVAMAGRGVFDDRTNAINDRLPDFYRGDPCRDFS
jgi:hypothetical protein